MSTYVPPILTVDVVLLELRDEKLWVGLIKRDDAPFAGDYALPGGFVHTEEDADTTATALRVIKSKAGLDNAFCEQLGTFSGPDRDPRGWSATVVYYALVRGEHPAESALEWSDVSELGTLAFDHGELIQAALARLRAKGSWSNLPAFLLPAKFTFSELRRAYEIVLNSQLNDSAFRRKIDEVDLVEALKGQKSKSTARPAQLYQLKRDVMSAFNRRI